MAKHPKLNALDYLFDAGKDFELTDEQYEKKTGVVLPKRTKYIINDSALAKRARIKGYRIEVVEKKVKLIKQEESSK